MKTRLNQLMEYWSNTKVDHSSALLNGVNNSDCMCLFTTIKMGLHKGIPNKKIASINSFQPLIGIKKPVVIDVAALQVLVKENNKAYQDYIDKLLKDIEKLKK